MNANDMAAMRGALEAARDLLLPHCNGGTAFAKACGETVNKIMGALASPPRNCDVGTAEEQLKRWLKFCQEHHDYWRPDKCLTAIQRCNCPCYKGNDCNYFIWAQMPYEAEEGGAQ